MKSSITSIVTGMAMISLLAGCNEKPSPKSSAVTTGMTMTGSGSPAVAQTQMQKLFSLFLPSAVALTPPALVDSSGLNVNLSEAWVVIKEIEFESQEFPGIDEIDGNDVEFSGPFFADLLSNAPVSFGDAQIPVFGIRRVKMKLHKDVNLPASAPLGLADKSIYFSGTVNAVAFTYSSDETTEFEISGPDPILPTSAKDMLVEIKTADLFKKINLSSITVATNISSSNRVAVANPCPLIDASASDLYTCFRKGLSKESNFGCDDGDFDLDVNDDSVR